MTKKITMACMALAALAAFALPATASATNDPQITHPTGTLLAAGSKITATQVGTSTLTDTSGNPELACSTGTMTGSLTKNSGGNVEGEISSAVFGGTGAQVAGEPAKECTGLGFFSTNTSVTTLALPWCLRSTTTMVTDEFQVTAGKCGTNGKIKFILAGTGIGNCEYEATGAIKGTYKTHPEDALLTVAPTSATSGFKKIAGSFICPTSGALSMSFTLETDTAASADPLYIS
jgi:hypothetical protein